MLDHLKVAIVHEWFVNYAGSERVVEQILQLLPHADLFAVVDFLEPHQRGFMHHKQVQTTFIQNLPFAKTKFRQYLPLMPLAIEQLDLSAYDLVISSSHAVAKGVLTAPHQLHIAYVHSPMRYAWDLQHQYLREANLTRGLKGWLARWLLHKLRIWDSRTANGVDLFIANSNFIARRIRKVYGRSSAVIYPPVEIAALDGTVREDFYLTASRLVPYKRVDLIVEAFLQMGDRRLIVIGEGEQMARLQSLAAKSTKKNIEFLGYQSASVLRDYGRRAKAFVFAAEEDFGIMPVEMQSLGTPVIAYGRGGVCESVVAQGDRPTGIFFTEQSVTSVQAAVRAFADIGDRILPEYCHERSLQFSSARFRREFADLLQQAWQDF
jgi:glycosyltransferase involved in cell wall biosynthesis